MPERGGGRASPGGRSTLQLQRLGRIFPGKLTIEYDFRGVNPTLGLVFRGRNPTLGPDFRGVGDPWVGFVSGEKDCRGKSYSTRPGNNIIFELFWESIE